MNEQKSVSEELVQEGMRPDDAKPAIEWSVVSLFTWLKQKRSHVFGWFWPRFEWHLLAEWGLIVVWACWVGRAYLDFNPFTWPIGGEMGVQLQTHYLWPRFQECGLCALWNGGINGGAPALADIFGSMLHPLVMVTTLLWGVMIGAKVALVGALAMAGVAQWWMARILGVGAVARVWSALLVVVGGHLGGRMENSNFGLVLSTAACSLALAAALDVAVSGKRRTTLLFALTLAMTIVAGQGYLQLALLTWAPAFLFLLLDGNFRLRPVWREYMLAIALSLLLAAVFLVPLLHFWPQLFKDSDPGFGAAQPLEYLPLNLVIRDTDFLRAEVLGKKPFPYMYNLYIGWVPLLLAILSLRFARRKDYPLLLCLSSGMVLVFLMASAILLRWLGLLIPQFSGFRHSSLIAALAIPAILALAAYGLHHLLALNWPRLIVGFRLNNSTHPVAFSLKWLMIIPLFWSLQSPYDLSQNYLITLNQQDIYESMASLQSPTLQWIALPFGELFWIEPALNRGLKVSNVVWAWSWSSRQVAEPRLIANRPGPPPDTQKVGMLHGVPLYENTNVEYAYVKMGSQIVPCQASGGNGDLTVKCSTQQLGQLIVQENSWPGWQAKQDQKTVPLLPGPWLSVEAPAGEHEYHFRYLPWDVVVGFLLTLVGIFLTMWLWFRSF